MVARGSRCITRRDELKPLLPVHDKGRSSSKWVTVNANTIVVAAFLLIGIMLVSLHFGLSDLSQTYDDSIQQTWTPAQTLASAAGNDTAIWQELEPPQMWSLKLGHKANQTVFYEHAVDFQSLKYGGPSASLNEVEIVEVDNFGCDPMDHEATASRIAIIQEGSKECELWVIASNAAKAGALAVLFYNSPAHDSLLSSPLLPQDWKYGDPLISIPVLSVTHSLGLAFLGKQSNILLSIVTKNMVEEMEEHNGDDTLIGKIVAAWYFIISTIGSTCHYVLDKISAAVTWLWEYSKAATLIVGAALLPIALNTASSLATKTVEFGVRCMLATWAAAFGMAYRLLRLSNRTKAMMHTRENQEPTEESVETVQPRGIPAPEREPITTMNTSEISPTHPLYNIYFVGGSFIAGLVVGGCFAVAVVAATSLDPV